MTTGLANGVEGVRWDLTQPAASERLVRERLDLAVSEAAVFIERWSVESIAALTPALLAELLADLARLRAARVEANEFAEMLASIDGENPSVRDFGARVDARVPVLDEAIRHFELAWVAIPDERAEALVADAGVAQDRHFLRSLRRFRPYMLSAAEEGALAAREPSACKAWQSLFGRTLGGLTASFDDGAGERECSLAELQSVLHGHPDRQMRRRAVTTLQSTLEPVLALVAQCYDAVVADRLAVDRLRGHTDPMQRRCLEDQVESVVVEQLLAETEAHYELGHRWFKTKARSLGLERLDAIDLLAPTIDAPLISWDEGRRMAIDVVAKLTPVLEAHADAVFEERRIDAEPRPGKFNGSYCTFPSTRQPSFLFLNWSGRLLDLINLTHELGHATHFALAAQAQSDNSLLPGLAVAEIPSTFAQFRLVDELLARDERLGRSALAGTLDQIAGGMFLAAAAARYEQKAYALRADGQALTVDRLSDLFKGELAKIRGDAMTDENDWDATMWATVPHFIHEHFYTYAYVFAFLVAAVLHANSNEDGFADRYERLLVAGGGKSPDDLMSLVGVDLHHPDVWKSGFAVIENWIDQFEATAHPALS